MNPTAGCKPIPGYRVTRPLGSGAFGDVWEAEGPGGAVALKFLDCRKRSPAMVAGEVRVLRELTKLQHPNIIPLHGVHAWGQYVILSMERADHNVEDLRQAYLQDAGTNIPTDRALDLIEQAAGALDFIAGRRDGGLTGSRGMQHCDVKPSNLLLVGGTLKVADFGLCAGTGWQTHQSGWRGTVPFAAPELYRGAAVTGTDQFALAVTFCLMVMGERALWPGDPASRPPSGPPLDLTKVRECELTVLSRALHPYPSSRYPSCRAFVQELRRASGRLRPSTRPATRAKSGLLRRPSSPAQSPTNKR